MNIEQIPIYDIKPYENNAKKHTDAQIEEIAKSIHDFGFNQNLVIDKNNVLVVGHGRWEAAKLLGLDTVPCVRAENLTDEQIRLYRLVDNRVATTPIDVDIELSELESIDLDISDYSFDLGEMQVEVEARQEAHEKSKDEYETDLAKIENIHKGIFEGEERDIKLNRLERKEEPMKVRKGDFTYLYCPVCGNRFETWVQLDPYCSKCGQRLKL